MVHNIEYIEPGEAAVIAAAVLLMGAQLPGYVM